jgi:hypothetical protein
MTPRNTIYMPLPDEGTDVWAPVVAEPFGDGFYLLVGPRPPDQFWRFPPGWVVSVSRRTFASGDDGLAVEGGFGRSPPFCIALCEVRLSPTGARRFFVFRRQDGLFQGREDHLDEDDGYTYWSEGYPMSGLYGSLDEAFADAPLQYR